MDGFMKMFARTWLATALFLVTSTVVWWTWLSWNSAKGSILPTILVVPPVWWWIVTRHSSPKAWRGLVAGALIGIATQVLPDVVPMIWEAAANPGPRNGEEQTMAIAGAYFYLIVGIGASVIGALLGWIVALIQKASDKRSGVAA